MKSLFLCAVFITLISNADISAGATSEICTRNFPNGFSIENLSVMNLRLTQDELENAIEKIERLTAANVEQIPDNRDTHECFESAGKLLWHLLNLRTALHISYKNSYDSTLAESGKLQSSAKKIIALSRHYADFFFENRAKIIGSNISEARQWVNSILLADSYSGLAGIDSAESAEDQTDKLIRAQTSLALSAVQFEFQNQIGTVISNMLLVSAAKSQAKIALSKILGPDPNKVKTDFDELYRSRGHDYTKVLYKPYIGKFSRWKNKEWNNVLKLTGSLGSGGGSDSLYGRYFKFLALPNSDLARVNPLGALAALPEAVLNNEKPLFIQSRELSGNKLLNALDIVYGSEPSGHSFSDMTANYNDSIVKKYLTAWYETYSVGDDRVFKPTVEGNIESLLRFPLPSACKDKEYISCYESVKNLKEIQSDERLNQQINRLKKLTQASYPEGKLEKLLFTHVEEGSCTDGSDHLRPVLEYLMMFPSIPIDGATSILTDKDLSNEIAKSFEKIVASSLDLPAEGLCSD